MSFRSEVQQNASTIIDLKDRIVTVLEWWRRIHDNPTNGPQGETPLLDLRAASDYEKQHLFHPRLKVVSFPIHSLKERSFELPARHVEFSILVDPSSLDDAQSFLVGPRGPETVRPKIPWNVTYVLLADADLWEEACSMKIVSDSSLQQPGTTVVPNPRLWQPDPMVQNVLYPLLRDRISNGSLQIWDLASGAGRDVAFLAEELDAQGNSYHVWGFDHRYNERETNITQGFWSRRGLEHVTKCIKMDLSSWDAMTLPTTNVAALFCVRFWKPLLVSAIARSCKIVPGTLIGISHFCKPHEGASWTFDHPSEKTVLERTQLRDLFQGCSWEIVYDEIAMDSDHGRPMIQFVARKTTTTT
jgi:hypothetical protein